MKRINSQFLLEQFDTFLLDAFGVLINKDGPVGGAREFLGRIKAAGKNFLIVSNGSKYTPEKSAQSYRDRGLPISDSEVITSGGLLHDWYGQHSEFRHSFVLGPPESFELVKQSGGIPTEPEKGASTLLICNQDGFLFPDDVDKAVSFVTGKIKEKQPVKLLLPNPDIVFPANEGFGVTSGAVAVMIEKALEITLGDEAATFERLGKPFSPIFEKAKQIAGEDKKLCMIGDQIETDIAGANAANIPSVLVETGICNEAHARKAPPHKKPSFILSNLAE